MADTLSESRACAMLTRLFEKRGYAIERNVPFREFGVSFDCDGWDRKARVGFEFLSSQHHDHEDLSLEEYQTLMDAQHRGRLQLLILDEVETLTVAELNAAATEFLDGLAAAPPRRNAAPAVVAPKKAPQPAPKKTRKKPGASTKTTPVKKKATAKATVDRLGAARPGGKVSPGGGGRSRGTGAVKRPGAKPTGTVGKGKGAATGRSGRGRR
ncbi:MAG: hypothetical protein EBR86_13525 [Planctomycetia bacterium]|nr:hypothetical protein [Planctomycetia bacterium]